MTERLFTCLKCEAHFNLDPDDPGKKCPVCGWSKLEKPKPYLLDCLASDVTGASCQSPDCDC
jgi:DNA-directed RNA polymerase subunit RPC12/RpoP